MNKNDIGIQLSDKHRISIRSRQSNMPKQKPIIATPNTYKTFSLLLIYLNILVF